MKESLMSTLVFRCVGKMHRSPEDETSGVYAMTAVQPFFTSSRDNYSGKKLACEQALRGAQAAGREKERKLVTTSLPGISIPPPIPLWLRVD